MFWGNSVVYCLLFWKWLSALMLSLFFFVFLGQRLFCECCCSLQKNFLSEFFMCWGLFLCFCVVMCRACMRLCAWVLARVCAVTAAAAAAALEVCAVATCGIPLPEIKWKKDIWALTAFQLILHLRLREDEKFWQQSWEQLVERKWEKEMKWAL